MSQSHFITRFTLPASITARTAFVRYFWLATLVTGCGGKSSTTAETPPEVQPTQASPSPSPSPSASASDGTLVGTWQADCQNRKGRLGGSGRTILVIGDDTIESRMTDFVAHDCTGEIAAEYINRYEYRIVTDARGPVLEFDLKDSSILPRSEREVAVLNRSTRCKRQDWQLNVEAICIPAKAFRALRYTSTNFRLQGDTFTGIGAGDPPENRRKFDGSTPKKRAHMAGGNFVWHRVK